MASRYSAGRGEENNKSVLTEPYLISEGSYSSDSTLSAHTGRSEHRDLEIQVTPYGSRRDIANIRGKYRNVVVDVSRDELHGLAARLSGAGQSLSQKVAFHLTSRLNKNNEFELFLEGLATTVVKIKLMGKVFPEQNFLPGEFSPELLREEIFEKLQQHYRNHRNKELAGWATGFHNFWTRWGEWFHKDITSNMEKQLALLHELATQQQQEILHLRERLQQVERYLGPKFQEKFSH